MPCLRALSAQNTAKHPCGQSLDDAVSILRFPSPELWGIEPPLPSKRGRKLPNWITREQATQLLTWCQDASARKQCATYAHAAAVDYLAVQIGLFMALRNSEICNLDIEHIDFAEAQAFICGKGNKEGYVPIKQALVTQLKTWIKDRTRGPVLWSIHGRRLHPRTLYWRICRAGRLSGLTKKVKPHTLRHSAACHLLQTGADLREVQELLRHSSISSTSLYLHCCPKRLRAAVERL